MGLWLSTTQEEEPECEPCYDVDDAPTCREEVDLVNDYILNDEEDLKSSILDLLNSKTTLEQGDEAISVFRDKQTMVDATRQRMRVAMYKKDGTFMVRDGDRCLTANEDAAFYKCGLGPQQMWAVEEGKLKNAATGECVDNAMNMVPCESGGITATIEGDTGLRVGLKGQCIVKGDVAESMLKPTRYWTGDYTRTRQYQVWNGYMDRKVSTSQTKSVTPYCGPANYDENRDFQLQPLKGKAKYRCVRDVSLKHSAMIGACGDSTKALFANKVAQPESTLLWCSARVKSSIGCDSAQRVGDNDQTTGDPFARNYADARSDFSAWEAEIAAKEKYAKKAHDEFYLNYSRKYGISEEWEMKMKKNPETFGGLLS